MIDKTTLKTTNKLANEYYKRYNDKSIVQGYRNVIAELLHGNGTILDVGCGTGRDVREFSAMGFETYAIDASKEVLKIAKKESPKTFFMQEDMTEFFIDKEFDGIWCCSALYHIPKKDVGRVLLRFNNHLKIGGVLFLAIKEGNTEGQLKRDIFHNLSKYYALYTDVEIIELLKRYDFNVISFNKEYKDQNWINLFAIKNG